MLHATAYIQGCKSSRVKAAHVRAGDAEARTHASKQANAYIYASEFVASGVSSSSDSDHGMHSVRRYMIDDDRGTDRIGSEPFLFLLAAPDVFVLPQSSLYASCF
jgi:hypothetical protein